MATSTRSKNVNHTLDDLPFYLVRAAVAFRRVNDCILRRLGIGQQPLGAGSILHLLFQQKSCTVKTLVEQTLIANGTLTGILDGLERKGLVRRVKNSDDGRSWLIQLTDQGERIREVLLRRHEIIMGLFNRAVSPSQSLLLKRALQRLTHSMNEHVAASQEAACEPGDPDDARPACARNCGRSKKRPRPVKPRSD